MVKMTTQCSLTYIKVYQYYLFLSLSKAGCQIGTNKSLTGSGTERAEGNNLHLFVFDVHEVHVRPHDTEGFRNDGVSLFLVPVEMEGWGAQTSPGAFPDPGDPVDKSLLVPVKGQSVEQHEESEDHYDAHYERREAVGDILQVLPSVAYEDLQGA